MGEAAKEGVIPLEVSVDDIQHVPHEALDGILDLHIRLNRKAQGCVLSPPRRNEYQHGLDRAI